MKIAFAALLAVSARADTDQDCHCVDRSLSTVSAVTHGIKTDPYWQPFRETSFQAAADTGITLEFDLYDEFDAAVMAADVEALADTCVDKCAAVVTIPDATVEEAVENAIFNGAALFGTNAGYPGPFDLESFFGSNETEAGAEAGRQALAALVRTGWNGVGARVAMVDPENGMISSLNQRWDGLKAAIENATGASATRLLLPPPRTVPAMTDELAGLLVDGDACLYDAVVGTFDAAIAILGALNKTGCESVVGGFDPNEGLFDEMARGNIQFLISQQTYSQSYFATYSAALLSFTGMSFSGLVPTGPLAITAPPSNYACYDDFYPVCPATPSPGCACTDRSKIRIAGVVDEPVENAWWNLVNAGARDAAEDLGVTLLEGGLIFTGAADPPAFIAKLEEICDPATIDALFVKISTPDVHDAVAACIDKGIAVLSINAGYESGELAVDGLLYHVGQEDFAVARSGAIMLVRPSSGKADRFYCVVAEQEMDLGNLKARCDGVADAAQRAGLPYQRVATSVDTLRDDLIKARGFDDGAGAPGIILSDGKFLPGALSVLAEYPSVVLGTFDLDELSVEAIDDGRLVFATDQFRYLQGYLPLALLTANVVTEEKLLVDFIRSGAGLVRHAAKDVLCSLKGFEACLTTPRPSGEDSNTPTAEPTARKKSDSAATLQATLLAAMVCVVSALVVAA